MNCLFLDPGINSLGVYIPGSDFITTIRANRKYTTMQKIQEIISTLKEYIKRHEIKKIYIEDYAYGISGQNPKGFVSMAEVKGVIKYFCFLRGILVEDVPISTWKKATIGFKASKKRPDEYMKKCERLAGRKFQTIDEADAYMMYLSIKAVP